MRHCWTPALRARFLDHLADSGNVRASCLRVGMSPQAAYNLRHRDAAFAQGWDAALAVARERRCALLMERFGVVLRTA